MLNNTRVFIEKQIFIKSSNLLKQYTNMRSSSVLFNLSTMQASNYSLIATPSRAIQAL